MCHSFIHSLRLELVSMCCWTIQPESTIRAVPTCNLHCVINRPVLLSFEIHVRQSEVMHLVHAAFCHMPSRLVSPVDWRDADACTCSGSAALRLLCVTVFLLLELGNGSTRTTRDVHFWKQLLRRSAGRKSTTLWTSPSVGSALTKTQRSSQTTKTKLSTK